MSTLKNCFMTAVLLTVAIVMSAQNENKIYYISDYMKVEPGMSEDYLACEKAWKKIHAHKQKMGAHESWSLERIISPTGSGAAYNYVTRHKFKDVKQLAAYQSQPYFPENWKTLVTEKEIALINQTSEFRTLVKSEVWSTEERIVAEDMSNADIAVINYFTIPKGKTRADHIKMERDLWMPFHKQNVANGKIKGWLLLNRELPLGSEYGKEIITVDVYKDMAQFWEPFDEKGLAKMHPGKTIDDIMQKTSDVSIRGSSEIRKSLDSTNQ